MIAIVTLLAAAASPCVPVAGAERLWLPATRWVLVGEIHGTNEMPDAFTNLVCLAASSGRPVTVALEYSADWQLVIDRYLRSDGSAEARANLLELPIWHEELQDGRSSVAFLQMLDRLRRMKRAGTIVTVICSDVRRAAAAGPTRDASMALAWKAIPAAENGIILALVGNAHAMRREYVRPGRTIVTAGSLMPSTRTITINLVANGGTAWDCEADGCGAHRSGVPHQSTTGIVFASDPEDRWSATYELGQATTAALPAIMPRAASAQTTPVHMKID